MNDMRAVKPLISVGSPVNLENNSTTNSISFLSKVDRVNSILNQSPLPSKPYLKSKMVASGTSNDNCGEISAYNKCKTCGTTYPVNHHCDRLECPVCHSTAAARIGKRGSSTLRSVNEALIEYLTPDSACDAYGRQLPNASIYAEYNEQAAKLANIVRSGGLRQTILSPPKELRDKWENYSNIQITDAFTNHVEKYLPRNIGGIFMYHPHRIKPEIHKKLQNYIKKTKYRKERNECCRIQERANIKSEDIETDFDNSRGLWDAIHDNVLNLPNQEDYVYFSPHYHIIHWGTMPYAPQYHADTKGWVYKITDKGKPIPLKIVIKDGQPLEDQLRAKITYLASHAGLFTAKTGRTCDVIHYFGIASPRSRQLCKTEEGRKIVKRIYESYIDCDKCGPGNHLTLCNKNETPILGRNGLIYAKDKLVVYKSELTPLGKQKVERLLNLNWPVSRIQTDGNGIFHVPDPPPGRKKALLEAKNVR